MASDISGLALRQRRIRILLYWIMALAAISVIVSFAFDMAELTLLYQARDQTYASIEQFTIEADKSDQRQKIVGWYLIIIWVALIVSWLFWTYRSSRFAHSLAASVPISSPAVSVAWYFVPFANLVMPYKALRQIIMATRNPTDWKQAQIGYLPLLWWLAMIGNNVLDRITFAIAVKAEKIPELLVANGLSMASNLAGLIYLVLTYVLVKNMYADQLNAANRLAGALQKPV